MTRRPPKGFTIPQRDHLLWLAVDLDGTLAEPLWTPQNPVSAIGDPIPENVAKLRQAASQGWKPIIHTSRSWTDYEAIEAWLNLYGIPFSRIVPGKLLAAGYVDDRAIRADADSWVPTQ